jgi:hypothetical protein
LNIAPAKCFNVLGLRRTLLSRAFGKTSWILHDSNVMLRQSDEGDRVLVCVQLSMERKADRASKFAMWVEVLAVGLRLDFALSTFSLVLKPQPWTMIGEIEV